jgi:hypothetical protein
MDEGWSISNLVELQQKAGGDGSGERGSQGVGEDGVVAPEGMRYGGQRPRWCASGGDR